MTGSRSLAVLLLAACGAAGAAPFALGGDEPAPVPGPGPGPGAPPPATAAAEARPRIVFDRMSHDFGSVKQKTEQRTEFTVKNSGTAPLTIASLRGDCGCASATISASEVAPGGSATITVIFNTQTFFGRQKKSIRVASNDPEARETDLVLTLDVGAGIVLLPAYFAASPVLVGSVPTATLRAQWKDGIGKPFKITRAECPELPDAVFTTTPFDAPPWHGHDVVLSFKKPPPVGPVLGRATIHTDDPEAPTLVADVSASVSGRVVLSQRVVTFGYVHQGAGAKREVLCRGFDPTIDLGPVAATATSGVVAVAVRPDEKDAKRFVIEIRLPEATPTGAIVDFIDVRTKVAGEERLQIKVVGTVLPATK